MKKLKLRTMKTCDQRPVFPKHLTWLVKTLVRAYVDQVLILGMIGDIARIIRRRQQQKREGLNTTCIACGGWIPKEREERRQHTCSEACQNWYRRLARAIDAGKQCRYCGRGFPKDKQKWPRRRRPGRPRGLRQEAVSGPLKMAGATRQIPRKLIAVGESVPLVPNEACGVSRTAIDDQDE